MYSVNQDILTYNMYCTSLIFYSLCALGLWPTHTECTKGVAREQPRFAREQSFYPTFY